MELLYPIMLYLQGTMEVYLDSRKVNQYKIRMNVKFDIACEARYFISLQCSDYYLLIGKLLFSAKYFNFLFFFCSFDKELGCNIHLYVCVFHLAIFQVIVFSFILTLAC